MARATSLSAWFMADRPSWSRLDRSEPSICSMHIAASRCSASASQLQRTVAAVAQEAEALFSALSDEQVDDADPAAQYIRPVALSVLVNLDWSDAASQAAASRCARRQSPAHRSGTATHQRIERSLITRTTRFMQPSVALSSLLFLKLQRATFIL